MNPEEREAILKILKIITAEQQKQTQETNELLRKILVELEKISESTASLERMYVAPS